MESEDQLILCKRNVLSPHFIKENFLRTFETPSDFSQLFVVTKQVGTSSETAGVSLENHKM